MASIQSTATRNRNWTDTWRRYERHISAAAMVLGFAADNYTFGRVDHPGPHIVFVGYLAIAAGSIVLAHALQARSDRIQAARLGSQQQSPPAAAEDAGAITVDSAAEQPSRLRRWLPAITQFALGGLWSGFLVFYWRSAALAVSWPFLVLLLGFLVGNEVFRRYHSRLVFASLLFFFALYSYAVFVVPVFTKTLGVAMFLVSGALAVLLFMGFLSLLKAVGHQRYRHSRLKLLGGAVVVAAAMNAFYFSGILPPLPLALSDVGVYQGVRHTGSIYFARSEDEPWPVKLGLMRQVVHVAPGQKLVLYSAVFAPIKMTTRISHRWQWWNARRHQWQTESVVSFAISGGRARGYRGYSLKSKPWPGDWRVDIDAQDGRRIGRLAFTVAAVATPVETTDKVLQ